MAPVRRAAPSLSFQGPRRWDWLLRVRRRRGPAPPPPPPTLPHASPERIPTPAPPVSPDRAKGKRKAEGPLVLESGSDGETSSAAMGPRPRQQIRRVVSSGDDSRARTTTTTSSDTSGDGSASAMMLLDKIRGFPASTFRPSYPRTVERGTRSGKDAKSWTCQVCQHENKPSEHLLFDLPAVNCDECGFDPPEGVADFGFSFADLGINDFCPIGNVKKQEGDTCVATSIASAVEIAHRVMMVVLEEALTKDGPFIDIDDLIEKYDKRCLEEGIETCGCGYNVQSFLDMLDILAKDGVLELESSNVHKIAGWTILGANYFVAVSSTLAEGYPLISGFDCGKKMHLLKPGEVYVPPAPNSTSKDGKRKQAGHAVVLVGAQQRGTEKFVHFLNSYGEDFCRRCHEEGDGIRGGVGSIRLKDLTLPPIQIMRFNESHTQVNVSYEEQFKVQA